MVKTSGFQRNYWNNKIYHANFEFKHSTVLVQISLKWDLFIKDNKKEHVKLIWNSSKNIQSNSNNNLNKSDYT